MSGIRELTLPVIYEDLIKEFSKLSISYAEMSRFVVPIEEAEKELAIVSQSIRHSGKAVLLLGLPGVGKSTFIQSLTWRKHLPISEVAEIDADQVFALEGEPLTLLYQEIRRKALQQVKLRKVDSIPTLVINYLEDLAGQEERHIQAFFRNLNGLLRKHPMLIIWPVTDRDEAGTLLEFASAVSGTVFSEKPILEFSGPPLHEFPRIAKDTISTLNPGLSFDDFLLTDEELSELIQVLERENIAKRTIRDYLRTVHKTWQEKSGEQKRLLESIPKPTEIWFVICYPEAETIVDQFARKSPTATDDTWDADYRRLFEYTIGNTQRAADWDAQRLQFALRGMFRTKIMFLTTHALVSCVASYGQHFGVKKELLKEIEKNIPKRWKQPANAQRFLESCPLIRQLRQEPAKLGKRRSGASVQAIKAAKRSFEVLNRYVQKISDQPINKCLAQGIRDCLEGEDANIEAEQPHPFLDNTRADILVVQDNPDKIICIELFYTINSRSSALADYVLKKLDRYMRQLEFYKRQPPLAFNKPSDGATKSSTSTQEIQSSKANKDSISSAPETPQITQEEASLTDDEISPNREEGESENSDVSHSTISELSQAAKDIADLNTLNLRNITRLDFNKNHGWNVRFSIQGKMHSKLFTDAVYNGKTAALQEAIKYRDEILASDMLEKRALPESLGEYFLHA